MAAARVAQHGVVAGGEADVGAAAAPRCLRNAASTASGVPSVEPLSTTSHSAPIGPSRSRAARSASVARSRPLWVTTTTLRSGAVVHGQDGEREGLVGGEPGRLAVDEEALPALEQQQAEQALAALLARRAAGLEDQALDRVGAVLAARERAPVEQRLAHQRVAMDAEPGAERGVEEPALGLVDDRVLDQPAARALEDLLAAPVIHAAGVRQARAELDELVVHEGDPHLERRRHRHLVEVQEHVVHEREPRVEVERLAERAAGHVRQLAADHGRDLVLGARMHERGVEQLGALVRLDDPAHREQALDRVVGGHGCDPARERGARRRGPSGSCRRAPQESRRAVEIGGKRGDLVLAVAAEELVGALPGEGDGHRLPRQAAEQQEAQARDVGDGLLHVPQRLVEQGRVVDRARGQLVVIGPQPLGHAQRVAELVGAAVLGERDRERLDGPRGALGHDRRDQARVEPAAEHHAERHVGDHPHVDGLAQQLEQLLRVLGKALVRPLLAVDVRVPVRVLVDQAAVLPDEDGRRRELVHAREQGARAGDEAVGEEQLRGERVELRLDEAAGDQRLDLRGEREAVRRLRPVQRLDAHAVAGEHEPAARARPRARCRTSPAGGAGSRRRTARRGGRSARRRRWWRCGGRARSDRGAARRSCRSRR